MKRTLCLSLVVLLALTAFGGFALAKDGPFTIAVVVKSEGNPFFEAVEVGCRKHWKRLGLETS